MHALLFAHQNALADSDLRRYAAQIGVGDVVGAAAQAFRRAVEADYRTGIEQGVRGTPTLFISGDRYTGKVEPAELRAAVGSPARTSHG